MVGSAGLALTFAPLLLVSGRYLGQERIPDHLSQIGTITPPRVDDESVRTRVFDWGVPIQVGGEAGTTSGTRFWTPPADAW